MSPASEDRLDLLRDFHDRGVSSMILTNSVSHGWADSSAEEPKWNELNDLGRNVVAEMNRLGMVIDISHVSDKTFGLNRRGQGDEDVRKIMGGNLRPVWKRVTGEE